MMPRGEKFTGFATAWPMPEKEGKESASVDEGEHPMAERKAEPVDHEHDPMHVGETLVEHRVSFAFLVGIGLGFFVYMKGYWIARPLTERGPLALVRIWLYRRMYFDELYFTFLVGGVMTLSWLSATFDKYVVDGLVNLAGWGVRQLSVIAGLNDKYVVDGAVNGVASFTQEMGVAVRAPQTGRIRMYVTVLMAAIALGLAVAIIVALS
jgi:hypothetical protein